MLSDDTSGEGSAGKNGADVGVSAQGETPRASGFRESTSVVKNVSEDGLAILDNQIEILPHKPMSHLDRGAVCAYTARGRSDPGKDGFFAMVCENNLVPRYRQAAFFAGILNPSLVRLVTSGVVFWPPALEQRYVFIYENMLGRPLMKSLADPGLNWKHDQVMKTIVRPMVNVLLDLRDADIVHGGIRPMNVFDGGAITVERAVLGECLSVPTGYSQPVIFETIERGMTDTMGRGKGVPADDLYAFGATLAVLLRNHDSLSGLNDEEIIRQKIELGSYAVLTGKSRYAAPILELLRGLLYDDPAQRWTLEEVQTWLEGQHLNPKQTTRKVKAARPIHFNEERYLRASLLAMDLEKNPSEASQLVDNGTLEQWIERSLEDKATQGRYEQALETVKEWGRGPGYWDRLLCRLSIALDPEAPLRYRGLKLHPEGLPGALVDTFVKRKDLQIFVDIINQQTVMFWLAAQSEVLLDVGALVSRYDSCRAFLRQPTIGYGIERCLYFLNPDCQCLSDRLKGYYVRGPEDMMNAFEDISGKPNRPELFVDRHIAAFLSVKERRVMDPFFMELNAPEYYRRVSGNLKVLASIQQRARMGAFPGIARWIVGCLDPVYERYHDRELRVKLKEKIEKITEAGDLAKIAGLLENQETRQQDFLNFRKAMREYIDMRKEQIELEDKLANPDVFARDVGQEYAAIASAVVAGIIILVIAFISFTGGGVL